MTKNKNKTENKTKYVAYLRVSTKKQGVSGLGLDAQRSAIENFCNDKGVVIAEFLEVESGNKKTRKELAKALAVVKAESATLIVAKLDRLARNVEFTFALVNAGVDFVTADLGKLSTLQLGILATVAEYEREMTAQRTKAACAEKRAKGEKMGSACNFNNEGRAKGRKNRVLNTLENDDVQKAIIRIKELREMGASANEIARKLNEGKYTTRQGGKWSPARVLQLEKMLTKVNVE